MATLPIAPDNIIPGGLAAAPAAATVPEQTPTASAGSDSAEPTAVAVAANEIALDPPKPEPGATSVGETPTAEPTPVNGSAARPTPTTSGTPTAQPTAAVQAAASGPAPAAELTSATPPSNDGKPPAEKGEVVEKTEEEPQNALTKKFTEAEWKALKEFRATIPAIIADAYSDSPDPKPTTLVLWGVLIHPNGAKDARASVILMKFLRARNLNPTSAGEMLTATLRWREQFKIDEVVKEEFDDKVFGKLGYVYGVDKEGRPVTYNLYGANQDLSAVFGDIPRFLRWRVQLMEHTISLLDFEKVDQMVQVHDYAGVSMRNRDANSKNAASEATSIFQSHYPEFLSKKFFINVPSILSWIFWLFKSLVSAQTFAKMSVVGSGTHAVHKALVEVIDDKEIPKRYGGEAEAF